jgi:hypothetical protein
MLPALLALLPKDGHRRGGPDNARWCVRRNWLAHTTARPTRGGVYAALHLAVMDHPTALERSLLGSSSNVRGQSPLRRSLPVQYPPRVTSWASVRIMVPIALAACRTRLSIQPCAGCALRNLGIGTRQVECTSSQSSTSAAPAMTAGAPQHEWADVAVLCVGPLLDAMRSLDDDQRLQLGGIGAPYSRPLRTTETSAS